MDIKKPTISIIPPSGQDTVRSGLVKGIDSVEVLAIKRSPFDEFVRAKIRVKEGELAGSVFFTQQQKSGQEYSPKDYTADEIADFKKKDDERDRELSTLASVVAILENGTINKIEPFPLLEQRPYRPSDAFLKKKKL